MNIQRLKFAWARGARIQWRDSEGRIFYMGYASPTSPNDCTYPDDEHLQYGPLSTALRHVAVDGPTDPAHGYIIAEEVAKYLFHLSFGIHSSLYGWGYEDEDEYRMLLLFAAELLADEGL